MIMREQAGKETGLRPVAAEYIASAVRPDQYPQPPQMEFAFIGRSNVGKSSLINMLCGRHGLARISGTPGKTRTINFYQLVLKPEQEGERLTAHLVDLPGYGYAKTGKENRRAWDKFVEKYLLGPNQLQELFVLIDARHSLQAKDKEFIDWLRQNKVEFRILLTKADKLSRPALQKQLKILGEQLFCAPAALLTTSAETGLGRDRLLDVIGGHLLQ